MGAGPARPRGPFCHPNTAIYRMRRIEGATGRSVADPRDRLLLTLGVMAARTAS